MALKMYSDICPSVGYQQFLEVHSFSRASLSENCSLLETDNDRGQISGHIFAPNGLDYCLYIPSIVLGRYLNLVCKTSFSQSCSCLFLNRVTCLGEWNLRRLSLAVISKYFTNMRVLEVVSGFSHIVENTAKENRFILKSYDPGDNVHWLLFWKLL